MSEQKESNNPMPYWMIAIIIVVVAVMGIIAFVVFANLSELKSKMSDVKKDVSQIPLVHLGSGKMMADGSEQRLFTFEATQPFTFDGWVNLKNMITGDQVTLKEYVRLGIDKEFGLYDSETYTGIQAKPMVFVRPKNALYGMMIVLQQTSGTFREFEWEFYKGVTS